ncbi:NADP dependent malic enzyme [Echinococcus multilocularis]|uniref:NADP dependent malic enzyme n=1 Tax=Echinococcus multilocularis TaxID=6211 RepID=A0A068Y3R1_ECHMU|nr:NADP dependent malic enzyme [Echinococcus multilocularis]
MPGKFVQGLTKQLPRLRNRGIEILRDPGTNKGAAYSHRERQVLGLHGLLPPAVLTQKEQVQSVLTNLYALDDDLGRYNTLMSLQDRNEKLFYKVVTSNLEYLLPLIYTPTVGKACLNYGMILRRPRGLYITSNDKGHVRSILRNWPEKRVKAVVVTDGERILGLGDLGAQGMGIPIGKCALYTALGGVDPRACLPLMIDIGTNNEDLLNNEFYLGLRQKRIPTDQYYELMDEVLESLVDLYGPNVSVQFEDMANKNSFAFLERYGKNYIVFNDDIQGSAAAVALAGLISATRITKTRLIDNKFLFYGAGSAATGIANILISAMKDEGASEAQAHSRIYMMDSKGLLVKSRPEGVAEPHKLPFVRDDSGPVDRLTNAVTQIKPTVLIGAAAVSHAFTREVLNLMANFNKRPVIFALSNPTEKAECTAETAFKSTECRCIFVSGSPFPTIQLPSGKKYYPSQGNNYYVFPGFAMAVTSALIRPITQDLFLAAAKTVADMVTEEDLAVGSTYPPVKRLREVAHKVAVELVTKSFANGTAQYHPEPEDKVEFIRSLTYDPSYVDFTPDSYDWPSQ